MISVEGYANCNASNGTTELWHEKSDPYAVNIWEEVTNKGNSDVHN
jgi:hypothetical protein